MQAAKPQDGSTVKGYRKLTDGDIERMNRLKDVSRHFCSILATERESVIAELVRRDDDSEMELTEALRCLEIARRKVQEACMWAVRGVARPDADC